MLFDEIDQSPRGRNDDIDPIFELFTLLFVINAPVNESGAEPGIKTNLLCVLVDLNREFARRRQNHGAGILGAA